MDKKYYCYIIANGKRTYNGYTVNITRRLRQHNREIKGGARATKSNEGVWSYIAILTCPDWTAVRAMQHEWTIKYPTRRRPRPKEYQGPMGRIVSLKKICDQIPPEEHTALYVHEDYMETVLSLGLPQHISLGSLNDILLNEPLHEPIHDDT